MLTSYKLDSILKLYFGSENNTTLYQKPLSYSCHYPTYMKVGPTIFGINDTRVTIYMYIYLQKSMIIVIF